MFQEHGDFFLLRQPPDRRHRAGRAVCRVQCRGSRDQQLSRGAAAAADTAAQPQAGLREGAGQNLCGGRQVTALSRTFLSNFLAS